MAAGVATVVGKPVVGPSGIASKNMALGFLALSNDYQAGGDSIDPQQLGLATIDNLILGLPSTTNAAAATAVIFPVVRSQADFPIRTTAFGGGALIKIQAFTATSSEASGDLTGFVIPYIAFGT